MCDLVWVSGLSLIKPQIKVTGMQEHLAGSEERRHTHQTGPINGVFSFADVDKRLLELQITMNCLYSWFLIHQ